MDTLMMYVWIGLVVVFGIMEAATAQLVSIWFVVGGIASLGAYFFGATLPVQLVIFIAVSALALVVTRPLIKRFTKTKVQPTNVDSYIGLDAVVTQRIDNLQATGTVKVKGVEWTARSFNGDTISENEVVTVRSIEGVKLIVERK